MLTTKKNISDNNNYYYGIYLSIFCWRISFNYKLKTKIIPSKTVFTPPSPFKKFTFNTDCSKGFKIAVNYKNMNFFNKKQGDKNMYHLLNPIDKNTTNTQKMPYFSARPNMYKIRGNTCNFLWNRQKNSPILNNFYRNLSRKNYEYFLDRTVHLPNFGGRDCIKTVEKEDLTNLAKNLNLKICKRCKKLGIEPEPHLIKLKKYAVYLLQFKIAQAEKFLKTCEKKQFKQYSKNDKSIVPSAPTLPTNLPTNTHYTNISNSISSFYNKLYTMFSPRPQAYKQQVNVKNVNINIKIENAYCSIQ